MTGQVIPHDVLGTGSERALLLHNWFGDRSSFDPMREHLDGDAFSYAFLDCRGYGEAIDTDGAFTMEEVAGDALAVADHLGWESFSVIGHSMGAKAAQLMLLDAPSRIRSLIGISAVPASGFPLEGETWELFAGAAKSPANRRAILDNTSGGLHDDAWLDGMVGRSVGGSSATAFRTYLDSWARVDFHERVKGNPVPVLLLAGANDPALGPEAMRATWMQWYPNAQLEVLPDTGHYAPEESPEAVAEAVERYLGR
ncbi:MULTISPECIES: alpha/beta fold hydrolase [unclassified Streptomyces]|uniref:alpha/beta fold hydrolase n=1 Tax=unclassified Streptomyces TaxID=2593676 RepID=UPI00214AEAA9|nr:MULTISPECIES: alpha/beta hydrolase [unclassified Streptomyces]MCX5013016.1 alpha/beta hydrolase [Streptomyces sp. NBC_00555]UUU41180.1 alpha/beta hydrolase [Streptomyces sp. NBC_00162]